MMGQRDFEAKLLVPALTGPARTPGPFAAAHRRSRRLLLRPATLPSLLQPHRATIRRSGRHLQDAPAGLPLRHHIRTASGRRGAPAPGLPLVPGLRHRSADARPQRPLESTRALRQRRVRRVLPAVDRLCRQAGLMEEGPVYVDSTLMRANASVDSLTPRAEVARPPLSVTEYLHRLDQDEATPPDEDPPASGPRLQEARCSGPISNCRVAPIPRRRWSTDPTSAAISRTKRMSPSPGDAAR